MPRRKRRERRGSRGRRSRALGWGRAAPRHAAPRCPRAGITPITCAPRLIAGGNDLRVRARGRDDPERRRAAGKGRGAPPNRMARKECHSRETGSRARPARQGQGDCERARSRGMIIFAATLLEARLEEQQESWLHGDRSRHDLLRGKKGPPCRVPLSLVVVGRRGVVRALLQELIFSA